MRSKNLLKIWILGLLTTGAGVAVFADPGNPSSDLSVYRKCLWAAYSPYSTRDSSALPFALPVKESRGPAKNGLYVVSDTRAVFLPTEGTSLWKLPFPDPCADLKMSHDSRAYSRCTERHLEKKSKRSVAELLDSKPDPCAHLKMSAMAGAYEQCQWRQVEKAEERKRASEPPVADPCAHLKMSAMAGAYERCLWDASEKLRERKKASEPPVVDPCADLKDSRDARAYGRCQDEEFEKARFGSKSYRLSFEAAQLGQKSSVFAIDRDVDGVLHVRGDASAQGAVIAGSDRAPDRWDQSVRDRIDRAIVSVLKTVSSADLQKEGLDRLSACRAIGNKHINGELDRLMPQPAGPSDAADSEGSGSSGSARTESN